MDEIISYIIDFLAGNYSSYISYGHESDHNKIVIIKCNRFYDHYGQKESMPICPIKCINGIPILYGENRIDYRDGNAYIYADLIASAYFMLSGYEESVNVTRDDWNRFRGNYSVAEQNGFLKRPVVDEYRILLEEILRTVGIDVPYRKKEIEKIYLTHDVDHPWRIYNVKSMVLSLGVRLIKYHKWDMEPLKNWLGIYKNDVFMEAINYFEKMDKQLIDLLGDKCISIFFILSNERKQKDTNTYINNSKIKKILFALKKNGFKIGLHGSPLSSKEFRELEKEKNKLQSITGQSVDCIRNHCLLPREYSDDDLLILGLTEDFTCGYADLAGFRIGTSRTVRYIDPVKKKLTQLLLHPLIIMDGTLDDERYMNMNYEQALSYVQELINKIRDVNGELNLLWHNHTCVKEGNLYHRKLYKEVLDYIIHMYKNK